MGGNPPLLDRAAERAGTAGKQEEARIALRVKAEQRDAARAEAAVVGSPTWRRMTAREYRERLDTHPLVEHFSGVERRAAHLTAWEEKIIKGPRRICFKPPPLCGPAQPEPHGVSPLTA